MVETADGPALATVTRGVPAVAAHRSPAADSPARVVRRATQDDVIARLKHAAAGAGGAPDLPAEDPGARPGDEADARRAAVRRLAADLLLHRRRAGSTSASWCAISRRTSAPASRCGRSASATKRGCSAATARAAGRCAARPGCRSFEPVSIKMAKQQNLSLNPSKLSGHVRPAEVLPALRAAERQRGRARRLRRRRRLRLVRQPHRAVGGCGSCGRGAACGSDCQPDQPSSNSSKVKLTLSELEWSWKWLELAAGLGSPSAIPPASDPEIARQGGCRSRRPRGLRAGPLRPVIRRGARAVRRRAGVGRGRPAPPTTRSCARSSDAQAGRDRRDRHRADQQGSVRRGRPAVAGPHRAARAPHRRAARRDDVLRRGAAGRARDGAHPAGGGPARADRRARSKSIDRCWPPRSCRGSDCPSPRLAVAGLNPHAGEHGLIGREDDDVLRPAIEACRAPRHRRARAVSGRHRLRARDAGRVRRGDRLLSRSGADPGQAGRVRTRRQRHARPADRPHVGRSRHRVRHRRPRRRRSVEPDRGGPAGGAAGAGHGRRRAVQAESPSVREGRGKRMHPKAEAR